MSEEQLKAFLEKVKADTILQEKLNEAAAAAAVADAVVEIAKKLGLQSPQKIFNQCNRQR